VTPDAPDAPEAGVDADSDVDDVTSLAPSTGELDDSEGAEAGEGGAAVDSDAATDALDSDGEGPGPTEPSEEGEEPSPAEVSRIAAYIDNIAAGTSTVDLSESRLPLHKRSLINLLYR
jgi:hypothetical protein